MKRRHNLLPLRAFYIIKSHRARLKELPSGGSFLFIIRCNGDGLKNFVKYPVKSS